VRSLGEVEQFNEVTLADTNSINDSAYEVVPAQILRRLRPDSIGSVSIVGNVVQTQFSGFDGYAYAVQASSNLVNWISVATNYPTNGMFHYVDNSQGNAGNSFYRSVLLP
jgi:hypothetical protein